MNSKSLRRLAADHGALRTAGLPPNYLFPPSGDDADMTSLDILLAGPVGTPYVNGVWRLHLDIPPTYPNAPPTATFRTRLWHPNIDEASGAVCVETLKRDWSSSLKLRDVLVTISCLLIQPNPASALNEAAGKLASEDWEGYCRRAKLMTDIHAAIPSNLIEEVREAQSRGDDKVEAKVNGKDKAAAASSKVQDNPDEDEENLRRRGITAEPESDPESDWIPGPIKSPKAIPAGRNNIFGIKGLEVDTPPKRVFSASAQADDAEEKENNDDSDPFITVPSKNPTQQSFSLRVPSSNIADLTKQVSTDTPELLKFSHQNPFSAIQPNNQTHPLIKEFSWLWEESEILHNADAAKDPKAKAEVRKRMASDEFKDKQAWELKKFKRTGYDLKKYNRGDFGPRKGIARL
ncbi:UBC-like protein, partial [Lentithecium fluviatile CBS 122367]